jgi:hypothetical protein
MASRARVRGAPPEGAADVDHARGGQSPLVHLEGGLARGLVKLHDHGGPAVADDLGRAPVLQPVDVGQAAHVVGKGVDHEVTDQLEAGGPVVGGVPEERQDRVLGKSRLGALRTDALHRHVEAGYCLADDPDRGAHSWQLECRRGRDRHGGGGGGHQAEECIEIIARSGERLGLGR